MFPYVVTVFYLYRFISFPVSDPQSRPRPGPASMTMYRVSTRQARLQPQMVADPIFRHELSEAFCGLYFLQPHSIVISRLERRPLVSFVSRPLYASAIPLYASCQGPHQDFERCQNIIKRYRQSW
jgi:hypothetical protein